MSISDQCFEHPKLVCIRSLLLRKPALKHKKVRLDAGEGVGTMAAHKHRLQDLLWGL